MTTTRTSTPIELAGRFHAHGCPGTRLEQFKAAKPPEAPGFPPTPMITTRCLECGGQNVEPDPGGEAA